MQLKRRTLLSGLAASAAVPFIVNFQRFSTPYPEVA